MKKAKFILVWIMSVPFIGFSQWTNQRLFDTTGFLPDHYIQRVAQFEKEPLVPGRIIFLGNSITEMGDWKAATGDSTVINRGIGGDITFGVLKRLNDVVDRKPSKVFLLIGINIGKDIPDSVIAGNIGKIVTLIKDGSPSTKVYVESILPVNPTIKNFPQHYDKQAHILSTNALIRQVARKLKVPYVNIHDQFTDKKGRLEARYTAEGLHLTQKGGGYQKWVSYLKKLGYL
jgi:lysophospholipase L1-like esterase